MADIPQDAINVKQGNDNRLVLKVYNQLSVNEARLLILGLNILRNSSDGCSYVRIKANDLVNIFGGNKGYYSELDRVCRRLCQKQILVNDTLCNIFSYLRFSAEDNGLYMQFNPEILSNLLEEYRENASQEVFNLNSMYAIKILELFSYYLKKPEAQGKKVIRLFISIDDLKAYLGVPNTNTYQQVTNLKNKVLNHPIMDINNNVHYKINYQVIKNGRKVTAFLFTMILPEYSLEEQANGKQAV